MRVLQDIIYGPHGEQDLLDLYLPDDPASPRPLVVCIHGGGWAGGDKGAYAWMGQSLAACGFAAASINYRLVPEWRWPAALEDAQRAVRWLRANAAAYGLDPGRVGAIGGSAGAHLACHLGLSEPPDNYAPTSFSSRVKCVVDCYGPVDFPAMMQSASAPILETFMGMPFTAATEDAYRQAFPYYHIGKFLPPFLIAHGTADTGVERGQVPLAVSERFHHRLRQAGADASLMTLEGATHGFTTDPQSPHARAMWAAAMEFFRNHLAYDECPPL